MGRRAVFFILSAALLIASIILGVSIGTERIHLWAVVKILLSGLPGLGQLSEPYRHGWVTIILKLRLPVVVMALFVGIGLSTSGASLQGLFKNPLVDPFIIGISAGGAFGYVIGLIVTQDMTGNLSYFIKAAFSFIFSMASVVAAYWIARSGNSIPLSSLLLAGIAISAFLTSLTQMVVYLFMENPTPVIFSLMGSCSNSTWKEIAIVGPVVTVGAGVLALMGREVNAFSTGEEGAKHLGVDVERSKLQILLFASLVAAITIPFCGMIGFVGLMVPHIVRKLIGPDNRFLIPGSALVGAPFLIISDLLSRTILDVIIPLGMVTGMVGGLFFVYLVWTRRRKGV